MIGTCARAAAEYLADNSGLQDRIPGSSFLRRSFASPGPITYRLLGASRSGVDLEVALPLQRLLHRAHRAEPPLDLPPGRAGSPGTIVAARGPARQS